jgi:hypothetical protein
MTTTFSPAAAARAAEAPSARIEFLSRYKSLLAVLVVLIHTGITYGAAGSWYYHDEHSVMWLKIVTTCLGGLSQSFALGAFFFLSAYFLPRSLERKGTARFFVDRLLRLGIPYVLFYFLVNPLLIMAIQGWANGRPIPFGPYFGSGPLWFIEALFIFTLVFMAVDGVRRARGAAPRPRGIPSTRGIWLYILCAAALGFAARIFFPIGWDLHNLQLGFFPMYVILFAAGIKAGRQRWLEDIPRIRVRLWAPVAAAAVLLFLPLLVLGGAVRNVAPFMGGLTWQNAAYAVWEAVVGTSLFITTLVLFSRARWRASGAGASFGSSSFGIYVLHAPVIILLGIALSFLPLYPALKWLVLSAAGIGICWGLTVLLKKVPGVSRVL